MRGRTKRLGSGLLALLIMLVWMVWLGGRRCSCAPVPLAPALRIERPLPELAPLDVEDVERFRNDLALSPYWRVGTGRDDHFMAVRRSAPVSDPIERSRRETRSPVYAYVEFGAPTDPQVRFAVRGRPVALDVYESFGHRGEVGPNSRSSLALRISADAELYVVLTEAGADPERKATFQRLPEIVAELAELAALRSDYRVETRYADFFARVFPGPRKEAELIRIPGSQGRDDFYGYLRSRPGVSYAGVSLKVSDPICVGECTSRAIRKRKAEQLGTPYHDGDLLYFTMSDTAIYLDEAATQKYGWFSGSERFEAKIELLNAENVVLFETRGLFQGWER